MNALILAELRNRMSRPSSTKETLRQKSFLHSWKPRDGRHLVPTTNHGIMFLYTRKTQHAWPSRKLLAVETLGQKRRLF